jgi:hypothetical protein
MTRAAGWILLWTLALPWQAALGFDCIRVSDANSPCIRWPNNAATMRSFLGSPERQLLNGTNTWDENTVLAANDWNAQNSPFRFSVEVGGTFINPCGARGPGHACDDTGPNGYNPIFFSETICGRSYGDIIELTISCFRSDTGHIVNSTVFSNANVLWNAYDGPIRFDAPIEPRVPIYDIRRVTLHELGHVLGLAHPDEARPPQNVAAIMNSRVSNLDRLQQDDVNGLFSIYTGAPPPQAEPTSGCQATGSGNGALLILALATPALFLRRHRPPITDL